MSDFEDDLKCDDTEPREPLSIFGFDVPQSALNRLDTDSYFAILDLPVCLRGHNKDNNGNPISLDLLELNIKGFTIPSIEIESSRHDYINGSVGDSNKKLSEFQKMTIKFNVDGDMTNYYTLYTWINKLVNLDGTATLYTKNEYSTIFTVLILDQYEQPLGAFTFHGVFPTGLGQLDLSSNSGVGHLEVDFSFSFDYFTFDLRK